MKGVLILMLLGLFVLNPDCYSQRTKPAVKAKTKVLAEEFPFEKYSYPFYAIINNGPSPIIGCFIKYGDSTYLVSTRHSFFTNTNEKRKITNVMIFMEQNNRNSSSKVLSLNMTDQRVLPVCFDFGCTDIILLPVVVPKDMAVNYVGLEPRETLLGKEMAIAGYTKDSANVILTAFDSFLERDSTFFLTTKSIAMDQSGAPVLIQSKGKGPVKVTLAGVYSGKEISQEHFDKGLVTKAEYISRFLAIKAKDDAASRAKPENPRRKKA